MNYNDLDESYAKRVARRDRRLRLTRFFVGVLVLLAVWFLFAWAEARGQEVVAGAAAASEPSAWQSFCEAALSVRGRMLTAGAIWLLVAVLKLFVLGKASPTAKRIVVALMAALTAIGPAWAVPGAVWWEVLAGGVMVFFTALGLHDRVSDLVQAVLPAVAGLPKVGPTLAAALRAMLAPSAPPVSEVRADDELAKP